MCDNYGAGNDFVFLRNRCPIGLGRGLVNCGLFCVSFQLIF